MSLEKQVKCGVCQYPIPQKDGTTKECKNYASCKVGDGIFCYIHSKKIIFDLEKEESFVDLIDEFPIAKLRVGLLPSSEKFKLKSKDDSGKDIYIKRLKQSQEIRQYLESSKNQYPLKIFNIKGKYNLQLLHDYDHTNILLSHNTPTISLRQGEDIGKALFQNENKSLKLGKLLGKGGSGQAYLSYIGETPVVIKIGPIYSADDVFNITFMKYLDHNDEAINAIFKLMPRAKQGYELKQPNILLNWTLYFIRNNNNLQLLSKPIPRSVVDDNLIKTRISNYFKSLKTKTKVQTFEYTLINNPDILEFLRYLITFHSYDLLKLIEFNKYAEHSLHIRAVYDPKFQHCRDPIEECIIGNNASNLVLNQNCPFFPIFYGTFIVKVPPSEEMKQQISRYRNYYETQITKDLKSIELSNALRFISSEYHNYNLYQVLIIEKAEKSVSLAINDALTENFRAVEILNSIIVQILIAIYSLQRYSQSHNDLILDNILFNKVDPNVNFYFKIRNKNKQPDYYKLPSHGNQIMIIDFGQSEGIVDGKKHECYWRSEIDKKRCIFGGMGHDIIFSMSRIYTFLLQYNKTNKNIEPILQLLEYILQCDSKGRFNLLNEVRKYERNPANREALRIDNRQGFIIKAAEAKCKDNCDTINPLLYIYHKIKVQDIPPNSLIYDL